MKSYLKMKEMPSSEQPYEKAAAYGIHTLSDAELIAIVIRTGGRGIRSVDLAQMVLKHHPAYPGLLGLFHTTVEELCKIPGIGRVKAIQLLAIAELAKRISKCQKKERLSFQSPESIAEYYMEQMRHENREKMILILLDGKNKAIRELVISEGTVNSSLASTREVFLEALKYEAVYVILLHNHPSGDPTPSKQDFQVTRQMKEAGNILGIPLLDHIVVGDQCYISFREQSLL